MTLKYLVAPALKRWFSTVMSSNSKIKIARSSDFLLYKRFKMHIFSSFQSRDVSFQKYSILNFRILTLREAYDKCRLQTANKWLLLKRKIEDRGTSGTHGTRGNNGTTSKTLFFLAKQR